MPKLIDFNGVRIVSAIEWTRVDMAAAAVRPKQGGRGFLGKFGKAKKPASIETDSLLKMERLVAKQERAVLIAGAPTWSVKGFLTADDKKDLGKTGFKKLYALAELISNLPDLPTCAIFVAPLPDDPRRYAMTVIFRSEPLPDPRYDVVVGEDDVGDRLHAWGLELSDQLNVMPEVIGLWGTAERSVSFEDLVAQVDQSHPLRTAGADGKAAQKLVMLAVVGGLAFYGYGQWKAHQRKLAAAEAAKRANPVLVYRQALTAAWASQTWSSRDRVLAVVKAVSDYDPVLSGFKMKPQSDIACDVLTGLCSIVFVRDGGTYQQFSDEEARAHRFTSVTYGLDGNTILVQTKLKDLPDTKPPAVDELPIESEIPVQFWSEIQVLPKDLVVAKLGSDYKLYPAGVAVNDAVLPQRVRTVGVALEGPLWGVDTLSPQTKLFATGINYRRVQVKVKPSNLTVTLEGDLYVRTRKPS